MNCDAKRETLGPASKKTMLELLNEQIDHLEKQLQNKKREKEIMESDPKIQELLTILGNCY